MIVKRRKSIKKECKRRTKTKKANDVIVCFVLIPYEKKKKRKYRIGTYIRTCWVTDIVVCTPRTFVFVTIKISVKR